MFSHEIVIEGRKYDCVDQDINKFKIMVSISEAKNLLDIYNDHREIPMNFKENNSNVVILDIKEQTYSRNDDKIIMLIEIGYIFNLPMCKKDIKQVIYGK